MSGPKWLVQELTVALILAVHTGILMMTGGTATHRNKLIILSIEIEMSSVGAGLLARPTPEVA